jgi:hypothetical protein
LIQAANLRDAFFPKLSSAKRNPMAARNVQISIVNRSSDDDPIGVVVFKSDPNAPSQEPLVAWWVIPYLMRNMQAINAAEEGLIYVAVVSPPQIRGDAFIGPPFFRGRPGEFDLRGLASIEILISGEGPVPPPPPFDFSVQSASPA